MTAARAQSRPRRRRGFVFVMVLILLLITTAITTIALSRSNLQSRINNLRLDEYKRHHEMMGLREVIKLWFNQVDNQALTEFANAGGVAQQIELPTGKLVSILVHDGQGPALGNLDADMTSAQREILLDMLLRLPARSPNLVRNAGPVRISLRTAPDAVVYALAGGDFELAETMLEARREGEEFTQSTLMDALKSAGYEEESLKPVFDMITFQPNLWRIDVEVEDDRGIRRYTLLATLSGQQSRVLEWRALPEAALFPPVYRPWDEEWRQQQELPYAEPADSDSDELEPFIE